MRVPLVLMSSLVLGGAPGPTADAGVVVEVVGAKSAAEAAGIKPGDVLLAWSRSATPANPQPAGGTIESPFALVDVRLEQSHRGPITLEGRRDAEAKTWTLPFIEASDLGVRPLLSPPLEAAYQEGTDLIAAKKVAEGAERWRRAAAQALSSGERTSGVWLVARTGEALAAAGMWPETDAAYEEAIREAEGHLAPVFVAQLQRSWADAFRAREDWVRVGERSRRALALEETRGPESLAAAQSLNYVGNAAKLRMQLGEAEEAYRRGLRIAEKWAPDSPLLATLLTNLGSLLGVRREFAEAQDVQRRALAIREKQSPGSYAVAGILLNLGVVAQRRDDLEAAVPYFQQALAIDEKVAPNHRDTASCLIGLGSVARLRRQWGAAEDYYRRALVILENGPPSLGHAGLVLNYLGDIALEQGDLAGAENHYRRALAMQQKVNAGTDDEALVWHGLGRLSRRRGRMAEAADLFLRALDTLESQRAMLGGSREGHSAFFAQYASYYHEAAQSLVDLGRPAEALQVLERSRARSLLALLAERDLGFRSDLAPELARERKEVDADYDRVQASLAPLAAATDGARIAELEARLRTLHAAQEGIAARIRQASPRLASLQYPEPLDLARVRAALDPGTLLLAYSVGKEGSLLFAVEPAGAPGSGISVFSLPVGESALREKIEALRKSVQAPREGNRRLLPARAAELYDLLLRPAQQRLEASARLLIAPEGPLHSLPFATLVRQEGRSRSYLVEWKPLTVVASATVHAELKKSRRGPDQAPGRLVAFGDPRYPGLPKDEAEGLGDAEVRSSLRRGFRFTPLPSTREEVNAIAGLLPKQAQKYLGPEATEAHAKSLGPETRYVHFACHATLDERSPLNSAVALTIPEKPAEGEDNGLLQAWEIFDHVRLEADLVTLSACNTGLGTEMSGEGLLGLRRAFHYAGARAVLASLWAVPDRSTSVLMKRFYTHLKAGRSLDQALRAAQMDLIRTRGLSHPFRWAAFQLSGDWR